MKSVLHISTECYPAAKAGGMGDVLGSLPKYLNKLSIQTSVIIPKYKNKWFASQSFEQLEKGRFKLGQETIAFTVEKLTSEQLGFPLYCMDIPGKFDRSSIYLNEAGHAFSDEAERNISFQLAVLNWILKSKEKFHALHCHDHMTGLIPFFARFCPKYRSLKEVPIFFTIHNGQYRGIWDWSKASLFPKYDQKYNGMLDWDHHINGLATALKCAWQVNTVSPAYMEELKADLGNLTPLIRNESEKSYGILNGIDHEQWDPSKDEFLDIKLERGNWSVFKKKNKQSIALQFGLAKNKILLSFIGRFAYEKGADLLVDSIRHYLNSNSDMNFLVLGSGDKQIESELLTLTQEFPKQLALEIAYNEPLARQIYAGSDFLIMPSRFEPCGLNQLFSMRYGTIPVVRAVGGLKDTVPDINQNGNGISFQNADLKDINQALERASILFKNEKSFIELRNKIVSHDYSWDQSAKVYAQKYLSFI